MYHDVFCLYFWKKKYWIQILHNDFKSESEQESSSSHEGASGRTAESRLSDKQNMIKTHEEAVINFTADREELIRESRQNEAYGEEIMTIIKSKCPSILGTDNNIFHLNSKIENIFYLIVRHKRYDDEVHSAWHPAPGLWYLIGISLYFFTEWIIDPYGGAIKLISQFISISKNIFRFPWFCVGAPGDR